jgi:O-methyltransferase domain/Dimerisation domain
MAPHEQDQTARKIPPQYVLLDRIQGLWYSKAIEVAVRLTLPDLLADGSQSVDALAAATGMHAPSLYRLLRALASIDIFAETEGKFTNTEISHLLRSDIAGSLKQMALWMGGDVEWKVVQALDHSIRTGENTFEFVYGKPIWQFLDEHPETNSIFSGAMTGISESLNQPIVQGYDFSRFHTVVDVGGGEGSLLIALLTAYPHLKGILFDRPSVIAGAKARFAAAGLAARSELVGGNMFEAVPQGCDAYILKQVIHDWSDAQCITILQNCRRAMAPQASVLIAEMVLVAENAALVTQLDLLMLVQEHGRERTEQEFRSLYEAAGFTMLPRVPTASSHSLLVARVGD